jgi:tetrapyrrole methylase family protein / MazG family protein
VSGPRLALVGLGPAGLDRVGETARSLLIDPSTTVFVRTLQHAAAEELAALRPVVTCDDLYDTAERFDDVYSAIAARVLEAAAAGPVAYAVPGSVVVGERAAATVLAGAAEAGIDVIVERGESFLDAAMSAVGVDPLARGLQVLDARALPDPLPLHLPTLIAQVDTPLVLADVATTLGKVLPHDVELVFLDALGWPSEVIATTTLGALTTMSPGPLTTLYLDPPAVGWNGLVTVNRRLRAECPWDMEQTHRSLLEHLIEEAYETVEAVEALGDEAPDGEVDFGAYAEVEEELGDLLLQVVFHATLASEAGAFDVEEVAEGIRRKLVNRHPHVFGDVVVESAEAVRANWEALKAEEKGRESLVDDVPAALPATARAAKLQRRAATVGFDWDSPEPVVEKLREEVAELEAALGTPEAALGTPEADAELGDVLFSAVNLARHIGIDAEGALRRANDRFEVRFREVERLAVVAGRSLAEMTLDEMDALWDEAKRA